MKQPKISVIMPSLNVAVYIEQCIESVINQTLRDIEIICVDAGSTDGTLELLRGYEARDPRVRVVVSDKKSYGYQMNLGMDAASGEYFGIVETDDYAEPDMFERLYACAKEHDVDVVKSGFFYYFSKPTEINTPNPIASSITSGRTFCPLTDFKAKREMAEFYNIKPTIWSAVYRLDFLRENGIRFNETPGASFQDSSFNFKVWACAKRVRLMEECFLHYRQDNEQSSVNSPGKVYCICDEYQEMVRFLDERPIEKGVLEPIMVRIKYDSYRWNYDRLAEPLQAEFIQRFSREFAAHLLDGSMRKEFFEDYRWVEALQIIRDPEQYHDVAVRRKNGEDVWFKENKSENDPAVTNRISWVIRKTVRAFRSVRENGLLYTIRLFFQKLNWRLFK